MDMQALHARRWWIAGPFLAGLVLMTLLEVSSVNLMSSVRAFVIGESLWSKEAKSAVIYLERYAHSRRSEDYRRFMIALAALVSGAERRLRMVGILRDVSEDFVAQQLRLDKEAAERANRAKGAFLSRVSHELRTPLNAVLGFSQLLQLDHPHRLSALQAERVQHIVDSSHRLLELINDMLDLSTLDSGGLGMPARDVDLLLLLDGCLRQMQPLARSHQVQLVWQAPAAAAMYVQADPGRLQQVFVNLLSNAIKYNRPGGTARLSCSVEGERAVVVVNDTGLGMDVAQLGQLFQPFNRLGAEYTKVPGSGLGLVITRQLLKLMGVGSRSAAKPGSAAVSR